MAAAAGVDVAFDRAIVAGSLSAYAVNLAAAEAPSDGHACSFLHPEVSMVPAEEPAEDISVRDFQQLIRRMYYDKDVARGVDGTFMWLMEEIGELAAALRGDDRENLAAEFADVIAWLATIANVAGVDLAAAMRAKYGGGCPGCGRWECTCDAAEKP